MKLYNRGPDIALYYLWLPALHFDANVILFSNNINTTSLANKMTQMAAVLIVNCNL